MKIRSREIRHKLSPFLFPRSFSADGGNVGYFRENGVRRTFGRSCGEGNHYENMDGEDVAEYGSCAYSESWY